MEQEPQTLRAGAYKDDIANWKQIYKDLASAIPEYESNPDYEVVAWGSGVYEAIKPAAWMALTAFAFALAWDLPRGNVWLLPQYGTRLTYPWVIRWVLALMFATEEKTGRRADWFLWIDDDIVPPPDAYRILRAAADIKDRPFVAANVYDRNAPYAPAAALVDKHHQRVPWWDLPTSGTHPVSTVGLAMAIIHRSVFDRVPEPWFGVGDLDNKSFGMPPDVFFSRRLAKHGITPHVCCDVNPGHLTSGIPMNRERSEEWNKATDYKYHVRA